MSRHPLTALAIALALTGGTVATSAPVLAKAYATGTDETFARAEKLFDQRKLRDASIELKNVLRSNPDHAPARLILGKIALLGGDLETAEKEIGRSHRLAPSDESAVLLGEIALQNGKPKDALAAVTGNAATEDLMSQKLVIRAAALVELGRLDEAEQANRDILAIDPRRVEGHFGLARVYAARKDYVRATDKVDEIVKGKPDYAPGWILRGEVSLITGDKHAAFYSFDKAVELQPNDVGPLISRARASLANGDIERARKDARTVKKLSSAAPIAHYLEGAIAFAEGDYDAANNSFTQLQRSFDRFAPAVLLGALIKTERKEYSQADSLFLRYIAMEPDNLDARRALATVRMRMGQPSNAVDILEKLLAETPDDTSTRRRLASAYLTLDRFDDARNHFTVLEQTGNPDEQRNARNALRLLDPATEGDPTLRVTILKASNALANGDTETAQNALDGLPDATQRAARVLALRGGIEATRGDTDAARRQLDAALSAEPELLAAHVALEQLDPSPGTTIDRLRKMVANNPRSEFLTLRLSRHLAESGRSNEAMTALAEGMQRLPDSAEISAAFISGAILSGRSDDASREALRLSKMKNASLQDMSFAATSLIDAKAGEAAVDAADRLAKRSPDSPRAVVIRAEALAAAGRPKDAYAALRLGLKRWPGHVGLAGTMATLAIERREAGVAKEAAQALSRHDAGASARLMAHVAAEMGQPIVGVEVLEQAFNRKPDSRTATALYGARVRAGREDAAKKGLKDWVARHPRDRGAMIAYATALMDREDYAEAEAVYADFLKMEPGNPVALNNYAWLRHRSDRPDALDYAERAFKAAGGAPEVADTYGWMLVEYGKLDRGLALLSRAAKMAPNNPEIGYHYAAALSKAGRGAEARTILTGVLDGSGKFAARDEAESLLSTLR